MNRPLRILVAHNVPAARRGGMSRIMGFIHDRVVRAGHTVEYLTADDVSPVVAGRWGRFLFPFAVQARAALAARTGVPYDIVNVHEPSSAVVTGNRRVTGGARVVVTSHGVEARAWDLALEEVRLGRRGPGPWSRFIYPLTALTQCRAGLRRADHVLCLNTQDRAFLSERFAIPSARITRIGPGVDPLYSDASRARTYASGTRLLFSATWRKNKGIEDLIPAFALLGARRPDVTLTVLGAGMPEDDVQGAFPAAVRSRVRAAHAGDELAAAQVYAAHDVFVLPSLFEGTPLTLLEAMASGLPVVTTATCGMLDTITDGTNGLLVPIRAPDALVAALERVIDHPALRQELGARARADALQRYSWDQAAAPVLACYAALTAGRP